MTNPPVSSLFDPASASPITRSADWIEGALLGEVAMLIAVIAVALVGLAFLTGRIEVRRAALVVLGCAVVFGAPRIASGLLEAGAGNFANPGPVRGIVRSAEAERGELPPADYNPYAGAALRDDR